MIIYSRFTNDPVFFAFAIFMGMLIGAVFCKLMIVVQVLFAEWYERAIVEGIARKINRDCMNRRAHE